MIIKPFSLKEYEDISYGLAEQLFRAYLQHVGASDVMETSDKQRRQIFKKAVNDYLEYIISVDELSGVCSGLYETYTANSMTHEEELFWNILDDGRELAYYERSIVDTQRNSENGFSLNLYNVVEYAKSIKT